MGDWISVEDKMPPIGRYVDLWITGEPTTISFYDPGRGRRSKSGRTVNWTWDGSRWKCSEGLNLWLSPCVTVTHWAPLPEPPDWHTARSCEGGR